MTTLLTEEQLLLRESARSFLAERYPVAWTRTWTEADAAVRAEMHRELWKDLAGLGWTGLLWPADFGGSELGFVEQTIVLEEMGRTLLPSPYLGTLLGARILDRGAAEDLRRDTLTAVCGGDLVLALALAEAGGADPGAFEVSASSTGALSGTKLFVPDAPLADRLIVAARDVQSRPRWWMVDRDASGLSIETVETMDATRPLHRVRFDGSPAVAVGEAADFASVWDDVESLWWAALSAEAVGGSEQVLEGAIAYAKERVQFGAPIGVNQAIKHKCADMLVRVEGTRAIAYHAARELTAGSPDARLACSMAKSYASEAYREVAAEGIQIHGGVGFTWEFDCHLFYKRARANEITAGHPDEHRERVAAGAGL